MKHIVNIICLVVLMAIFVSAPVMAQTTTPTPFFSLWQQCVQYHMAHPDAPGYVPASTTSVQPTGRQTLGSLSVEMSGCYPTNAPASGWVLRTAGDPTITEEGVVVRDPRNGAAFGQPMLFRNMAVPPVVANTNNCPSLIQQQMPTPARGMLRTQVVHKQSDCGGVSTTVDDTQQTPSDAKHQENMEKIDRGADVKIAQAQSSGGCGTACRIADWFLSPLPCSYYVNGLCVSNGYNSYGYGGYPYDNNNLNPISFHDEGRRGGGDGRRSPVSSQQPVGVPPGGTTGPVAPGGGTGVPHIR
jgi:hypothetical protein